MKCRVNRFHSILYVLSRAKHDRFRQVFFKNVKFLFFGPLLPNRHVLLGLEKSNSLYVIFLAVLDLNINQKSPMTKQNTISLNQQKLFRNFNIDYSLYFDVAI